MAIFDIAEAKSGFPVFICDRINVTMFTHAIVRRPGHNFNQGLTTSLLGTPSFTLIKKQHDAYVQTLGKLGLEVMVLDPQPDYPDAYFVEDTTVVTPEVAVMTIPGAISRQGEQTSIEPVLFRYRKIENIQAPGTVDGGDVLMAGDRFFIGISDRTNTEGARQLGAILESYGYKWDTVSVGEGLHLKSSINYVGENTLILAAPFQRLSLFDSFGKIVLEETETYAANTLWINDTLIMPKGFPAVKKQLSALDLPILELDMSEAAKMDGGLTCLSIRL
jgi:dimethylargininase